MSEKIRRSHAAPIPGAMGNVAAATLFTVKGDPAEALAGVALPAGAEVAIVSPTPETSRKIRQLIGKRLSRAAEIVASGKVAEPVGTSGLSVDNSAFEPDARSRAVLAGVRRAQEDLRQAGGAYDLEQVRLLMHGISRQAVDKRVQDGSLLAVPGPSNRRSYPTVQFGGDGAVVPGLKAVREALRTTNPWAILNFLVHPDDRLGAQRPVDLLKEGKVAPVVEAARRYGEQGA